MPDDVIAILVMSLFEHVRYLDERVFGQVLEDRYTVEDEQFNYNNIIDSSVMSDTVLDL